MPVRKDRSRNGPGGLAGAGRAAACTLLTAMTLAGAPSVRALDATTSFVILQRNSQVGTASSSVSRTADGWSIEGTTQLTAPVAVTVNRVEVSYTPAWAPRNVTVDLASPTDAVVVHGSGFGARGPARIDIVRGGRQVTFVTATVSRDALILPNFAYAAYEALAARLDGASTGARLMAYVLPQREIGIRVDGVNAEELGAGAKRVKTTRYELAFLDPSGPATAVVWVDGGRLARFELPSQQLVVVRADVAGR